MIKVQTTLVAGPRNQFRRICAAPTWYVLEQIQSPQPPTVDSRRVHLSGVFYMVGLTAKRQDLG
jgi:hypothetical protein